MSTVSETVGRIAQKICSGASVAVAGPPGIGKSYILDRVADSLTSQGMTVTRVEIPKFDSGLQALSRMLGIDGGTVESFADLESGVEDRQSGTRIAIVDGFDSCVQFPDAGTLMRHVREHVQFGRAGGLVVLLAARRPLRVIEEGVNGISTLESVFDPIHLVPLDREDLAASWPRLVDDEVAIAEVLTWSWGIPALARKYVEEVLSRRSSVEVLEYDRVAWVSKAVDYLDKIGFGEALPQYMLGPVVAPNPLALARLRSMGVLPQELRHRRAGERPLCDFPPFLQEVRRRNTALEAWGPRGTLEMAARRLASELLSHVGASDAGGEEALAGAILASGRRAARAEGIARPTLRDAVDRLGEGELWAAIDSLWDESRLRFSPDDRKYWKRRLEPLGGVGRLVGVVRNVDGAECAKFTQEVERQMTRWAGIAGPEGGAHAVPTTSPQVQVMGSVVIGEVQGAVAGGDVQAPVAIGAAGSQVIVGDSGKRGHSRWQLILGVLSAVAAIATIVGVVLAH